MHAATRRDAIDDLLRDRPIPLAELKTLDVFQPIFLRASQADYDGGIAKFEQALGRPLDTAERAALTAWLNAASGAAEQFLREPDAVDPDSFPLRLRQILVAMGPKAAK
jgi:hypothetical protein